MSLILIGFHMQSPGYAKETPPIVSSITKLTGFNSQSRTWIWISRFCSSKYEILETKSPKNSIRFDQFRYRNTLLFPQSSRLFCYLNGSAGSCQHAEEQPIGLSQNFSFTIDTWWTQKSKSMSSDCKNHEPKTQDKRMNTNLLKHRFHFSP